MALITIDTARASERQSIRRVLRDFHARIDFVVRDCMKRAVAEGSRVRLFGCNQSARLAGRDPAQGAAPAESMHLPPAVAGEPQAGVTRSLSRRVATSILSASWMLVAFAGTVALQAAIHIYVLRLIG